MITGLLVLWDATRCSDTELDRCSDPHCITCGQVKRVRLTWTQPVHRHVLTCIKTTSIILFFTNFLLLRIFSRYPYRDHHRRETLLQDYQIWSLKQKKGQTEDREWWCRGDYQRATCFTDLHHVCKALVARSLSRKQRFRGAIPLVCLYILHKKTGNFRLPSVATQKIGAFRCKIFLIG